MPRHSKKEPAVLPAILGIAGVGIIAALAFYLVTSADPVRLDPITQCPIDPSQIRAYTVIIVDRTEALNEVQVDAIRTSIRKEIEASSPYEKVSMYELVGRSSLDLQPFAQACNPTSPASGNQLIDKLDKDEALARKRFRDKFEGELMRRLDMKLHVEPQHDSPIMEMIQAVSIKDLRRAPERAHRKLIIVSDMMQHSPGASHYHGLPGPDFFASTFFRKVSTDLSGTDVRVYYIDRAGSASQQANGHKQFWNTFFLRLGAVQVVFVPIEGAGWVRK